MNQSKFYKYLAWSLVGLNIAVLAFFLLSKSDRQHEKPKINNRSEVIELLRLDEQQAVQLNALADEHTRRMHEFRDQQAKILSPYFLNVIYSESMNNDSLLYHDYLESEKAKIEMTYSHFQEIRKMLRDEQIPHFQTFMKKTVDRVLLGKKKIDTKRRK